ncbi:MAG: RNA polymerase sigma factor [Endomicrobiales bacterium]
MYKEEKDFDLVQKARKGDREAFGVLVERYQDELFFLARNLVSSMDEARDLTSESFVRAWKHIRGFRDEASFKTCLWRILINLSRSHLRRRYLRNKLFFWRTLAAGEDRLKETEWVDPSPGADPEKCAEQKNIGQVVQWARTRLSPREQEVFTLKYDRDMKTAEIAAMLSLSGNTVKVLLFRATKKMAAALKGYRK